MAFIKILGKDQQIPGMKPHRDPTREEKIDLRFIGRDSGGDRKKVEKRALARRRHAGGPDPVDIVKLDTAKLAFIDRFSGVGRDSGDRRPIPAEPVRHHDEPPARAIKNDILARDNGILKKR